MHLKLYQVDAFTDTLFSGNPITLDGLCNKGGFVCYSIQCRYAG